MPGYKKILQTDERDIYEQAISKQQQHKALVYVLGQKAAALNIEGGCDDDFILHCDDEDDDLTAQQDLGQDIVPIDEHSHGSSDEFKTKKNLKDNGSDCLTESSISNSELKDKVQINLDSEASPNHTAKQG